ncbi:MAG: hypothetical protein WCQ95_06780 [Bacteroidota bacterium]
MNFQYNDYNEIRPYNDLEVPYAVGELVRDADFITFLRYLFPNFNRAKFVRDFKTINNIYDFQAKFAYAALNVVIERTIESLTCSGVEGLEKGKSYLFISTHRDIVLDSSLMNYLLFEHGHQISQTAIGDNLFVSPMVTHLLKLNKSFTVKRNIPQRAFYDYSKQLSAYITDVIVNKNSSVWLAQREGRAKDGDDKTQYGLLKMLVMHGDKNEKEIFSKLKVLPVAVSYEYDPCDVMKAVELYAVANELPFQKTPDKDFKSMLTGIQGLKGKVHVAFGKMLEKDTTDDTTTKGNINEWLKKKAEQVDKQVYSIYKLWNTNYIAYDLLNESARFSNEYNEAGKEQFVAYINEKLVKIPVEFNKEEVFKIILAMYANPVKNNIENELK